MSEISNVEHGILNDAVRFPPGVASLFRKTNVVGRIRFADFLSPGKERKIKAHGLRPVGQGVPENSKPR